MARSKTARHRAQLKAKHRKARSRKASLLKKKRPGGRLTATARGKEAKTPYLG